MMMNEMKYLNQQGQGRIKKNTCLATDYAAIYYSNKRQI